MKSSKGCAVCDSKHLKVIEELFDKGYSSKQAVNELRNNRIYGFTYQILAYHRGRHYTPSINDNDKKKPTKISVKTKANNRKQLKNKQSNKEEIELKRTNQVLASVDDVEVEEELVDKRKQYIKQIKNNTKDLDIIKEIVDYVNTQKARYHKALEEEEQADMVLGITNKVSQNYLKALESANELTKGIESLREVRLAEMAQMFVGLVARHEVTDSTRFELFNLLRGFESFEPDLSVAAKNDTQLAEMLHKVEAKQSPVTMIEKRTKAKEDLKKPPKKLPKITKKTTKAPHKKKKMNPHAKI